MGLWCLIWLLSAPAAIRLLLLILNYWAQTDASEIATSSNEFLSTPSALQSDKRPGHYSPRKTNLFAPSSSLSELNSSASSFSSVPFTTRWAGGQRLSACGPCGVRSSSVLPDANLWAAVDRSPRRPLKLRLRLECFRVGSEGRRRVLGLMLGARESAQVLILASLESRDSLGFLSWAFKFSSWFCLPLGTYGGNGVKIWSYSCFLLICLWTGNYLMTLSPASLLYVIRKLCAQVW